jgi:site-specific DNA-methyltransferase (adenine-specific)
MTEPIHTEPLVTRYRGDCVEVMAQLPEQSVDAIVTDPPYGFAFMGAA